MFNIGLTNLVFIPDAHYGMAFQGSESCEAITLPWNLLTPGDAPEGPFLPRGAWKRQG